MPGTAADDSRLQRRGNLPEDLRFAHYLRIQTGSHTEKVPGGVVVRTMIKMRRDLFRSDPGTVEQIFERCGRCTASDAHFRAVTGGEQHGFVNNGQVAQAAQHLPERRLFNIQPLTQFDGSRGVIDAKEENRH